MGHTAPSVEQQTHITAGLATVKGLLPVIYLLNMFDRPCRALAYYRYSRVTLTRAMRPTVHHNITVTVAYRALPSFAVHDILITNRHFEKALLRDVSRTLGSGPV